MMLDGLEALAEDGSPGQLDRAVGMLGAIIDHGIPAAPDGAMGHGPAMPGHSYSFHFKASRGLHLSFATMYVQSNDLFFSTGAGGIILDPEMTDMNGIITDQVVLYDAGTEVNQQPGKGPDQPLRQPGPDTGMDEKGTVQPVMKVMDGFEYPPVEKLIKVTLKQSM